MPRQKLTSPRKLPVQQRSQAIVTAILEGAARVLIEDGYEAFNTNHVAERAGVSIGSLYQYFPNKAALIAELSRRHVEDTRKAVQDIEISSATPMKDIARQMIRNHIALHKISPELHRVLSDEVPKLGGFDWQSELLFDIRSRLVSLLKSHPETRDISDSDLAVFLITSCVEAVTHDAIATRPGVILSGAIEEELMRLVMGYLQNATREGRESCRC